MSSQGFIRIWYQTYGAKESTCNNMCRVISRFFVNSMGASECIKKCLDSIISVTAYIIVKCSTCPALIHLTE